VASAPLDVERLVETLARHAVDFVVIGGIAAVMHGSARSTFDLDISLSTDAENLDRLGAALVELKSRLRGVPEDVPFVPDAGTLKRIDVLTLSTVAGDLDVLRAPDGAPRYDVLARRADPATIGDHAIRVASIEDLIAMKTAANREKDKADVVDLESILRLRKA
jgi:hypothetical protein